MPHPPGRGRAFDQRASEVHLTPGRHPPGVAHCFPGMGTIGPFTAVGKRRAVSAEPILHLATTSDKSEHKDEQGGTYNRPDDRERCASHLHSEQFGQPELT